MSERTDVLLRIKYRKNNQIMEDDILDNIDLYDAIVDLNDDLIVYEDEEKLILRTGSNYVYLRPYEDSLESEELENLYILSEENNIDNLYYIFCNYSESIDLIVYGIIEIHVLEKGVNVILDKTEKYSDVLEKIYGKDIFDRIEESEEEWDEKTEEFREERWEKVNEYCYARFMKYLENIDLDRKYIPITDIEDKDYHSVLDAFL